MSPIHTKVFEISESNLGGQQDSNAALKSDGDAEKVRRRVEGDLAFKIQEHAGTFLAG